MPFTGNLGHLSQNTVIVLRGGYISDEISSLFPFSLSFPLKMCNMILSGQREAAEDHPASSCGAVMTCGGRGHGRGARSFSDMQCGVLCFYS